MAQKPQTRITALPCLACGSYVEIPAGQRKVRCGCGKLLIVQSTKEAAKCPRE